MKLRGRVGGSAGVVWYGLVVTRGYVVRKWTSRFVYCAFTWKLKCWWQVICGDVVEEGM